MITLSERLFSKASDFGADDLLKQDDSYRTTELTAETLAQESAEAGDGSEESPEEDQLFVSLGELEAFFNKQTELGDGSELLAVSPETCVQEESDPLLDLPNLPGMLNTSTELELSDLCGAYEEYKFWDRLEQMLAYRDLTENRSFEQWNWLPESEKQRLYNSMLDKYDDEFTFCGLQNLYLKDNELAENGDAAVNKAQRVSGEKIIQFPNPESCQ